MMYYARPSIWDRFVTVLKTLSGLFLCLAIFMAGTALQEKKETEVYQKFLLFLEDVTDGLYDYQFNQIPEEFHLDSFEHCRDGSYYLSGKIYTHRFCGYTTKNNMMGKMTWQFSSHPGWGGVELWIQALALGGMAVCVLWLLARAVFKLPPLII